MKHPVKPTRQQRNLMERMKLNPSDWFVAKDTPQEMLLQHRHFDSVTKIIRKSWVV